MKYPIRSGRRWALGCVLALSALATVWAGDTRTGATSRPLFDADAYLEHVKYLAGEECEGRRPGTPGIELAAEYIAKQFAGAGLKPAGENGTWFQSFQVQRGKKIVAEEALLKVEGIERDWKVREDWIPLPFSSTEDVQGPLAFVGYGITAHLHGYDDYEVFDAKDKIVLMFRYEPQAEDPNAAFGGKTPSRYSLFSKKVGLAARQGAKAVLIVNPPKRAGADDKLYAFDEEFSEQTFELPVVHVRQELAEAVLKKAGIGPLATLQEKLDRDRKPLSADLGLTIELRTGVKPNSIGTRNVVGLLSGEGGTTETIVVGAHYDHLGKVPHQWDKKDSALYVHYGADDNASGTAGVIELARLLAKEGGLRRNVLFMTFSAEEMGLLGSAHFVSHPTLELSVVKAMVNFDMIGRLGAEKFTIYGVGTGQEFDELVKQAAEEVGIEYRAPKGVGDMFGASDHASFFEHEIPVLFPFTGVHKQYHRPEDRWDLIDAQGATQILTMFHRVVRELANMPAGPTFQKPPEDAAPEGEPPIKPAVEHEKEVQRDEGEHGESGGGEVEARTRPKSRLGIIPDFAGGEQPGVVVSSVLDGGAAKAAGIQDGDRIVRLGDQKIKDIYGYMDALRECRPGQTVEVVVMRKDQEMTFKVTLTETQKRRVEE